MAILERLRTWLIGEPIDPIQQFIVSEAFRTGKPVYGHLNERDEFVIEYGEVKEELTQEGG